MTMIRAKSLCILSALSVFCVGTAAAESMTCTMTQECILGEDCAQTEFSFTLEILGKANTVETPSGTQIEANFATLVTDAETIPGIITRSQKLFDYFPVAFYGLPDTAVHAVSFSEAGTAVYTVQMPQDTFAIVYTGQCGDAK